MKVILLTVAAIPLLLLGMIASSSFVIVDVTTEDGPHIVIPVPLALAQTALRFAPIEVRDIPVAEIQEYAPIIDELVDELSAMPDAVLVEVEDGQDHVLVEKVGDEIAVSVRERGEDKVDVHIPLAMLRDVVDSFDGESLELHKILRSIGTVSNRDLVHVKDGGDEVKVWIW